MHRFDEVTIEHNITYINKFSGEHNPLNRKVKLAQQ